MNEIRKLVSSISEQNSLAHYGVLGMRWGVRKKRYNDDKLKRMSDDELKRNIQRLQMEQQYKRLTKQKKSFGKKLVDESLIILGGSVKRIATKKVDAALESKVDTALEKIETAFVKTWNEIMEEF